MKSLQNPSQNRLLNRLNATSNISFLSEFELVYLPQGKILFDAEQKLTHSYFPTTAVISTEFRSTEKLWIELETIRNDGLFGLPSSMDDQLVTRAIVQSPGYAYIIQTNLIEKEIVRSNDFFHILLIFLQLRLTKISQIAICSRFHSIEQQLCRLLLNALDYSPTNTLNITQYIIAAKLNVRRESIASYAAKLHREGILNVMRGKVTIIKREALEKRTCECYQVILKEVDRLLNYAI